MLAVHCTFPNGFKFQIPNLTESAVHSADILVACLMLIPCHCTLQALVFFLHGLRVSSSTLQVRVLKQCMAVQ